MNFKDVIHRHLEIKLMDNMIYVFNSNEKLIKQGAIQNNECILEGIENNYFVSINDTHDIKKKLYINHSKLNTLVILDCWDIVITHTKCSRLIFDEGVSFLETKNCSINIISSPYYSFLYFELSSIKKVIGKVSKNVYISHSVIDDYDINYTETLHTEKNDRSVIKYFNTFVKYLSDNDFTIYDGYMNAYYPSFLNFKNGNLLDIGNDVSSYLLIECV